MHTYTLGLAWNWEFDYDFIAGIERECAERGMSTYRIDPHNLRQTLGALERGELTFRAYFDRASDADPAFLPLVHRVQESGAYCINPHHRVVHAVDKATMHVELLTHGIDVPFTVILPPYNRTAEFEVHPPDFARLAPPFVIKPANTTGGGTGVVLNASTLADIARARQDHRDDKYLLQEMIRPRNFDGKRGWFRCYCVFQEVISCWWDDTTHMYSEIAAGEEERYGLSGLRKVMKTIQETCMLDFFSSEIAVTVGGKFVVVDYVNEVCDMRLKSLYHNGAPDAIVHRIEQLLASQVASHLGGALGGAAKIAG
jgi:hypothetical protein